MATLLDLKTAILDISRNHYILDAASVTLNAVVNNAVNEIAGGLRLPDGNISPPLPHLYTTATVATSTTLPYVDLPSTYQRSLVLVADAAGVRVPPPDRCDYYGFAMFMEAANNLLLSGAGAVVRACVKGPRLYYQAIPAASVPLTIAYHRAPVPMTSDANAVDGIPEQFQVRLVRHYVGKQLANEMVDGTERMVAYHTTEFNQTLMDMVEFLGLDRAPTDMRRKPVVQAPARPAGGV